MNEVFRYKVLGWEMPSWELSAQARRLRVVCWRETPDSRESNLVCKWKISDFYAV